MACGRESLVIVTSDNGKTARPMGMEYISGKMEIDLKEAGLIASSTERELICLQMEMSTQETMHLENLKARVFTNGKMEASTLVSLKRA